MNRTNELVLQTPEGVRFRYRLAGPAARFLAVSIDVATVMLISSSVAQLCYLLGAFSSDFVPAAQFIAYFALTFGYSIFFEWIWRLLEQCFPHPLQQSFRARAVHQLRGGRHHRLLLYLWAGVRPDHRRLS